MLAHDPTSVAVVLVYCVCSNIYTTNDKTEFGKKDNTDEYDDFSNIKATYEKNKRENRG